MGAIREEKHQIDVLEDLKNPSGHGVGQFVLPDPAWEDGLDAMTSRGHFKLQPLCDSEIPIKYQQLKLL